MKQQNRQQVVCDYIYDNYTQYGRLRRDVISNKVQINDGLSRADALNDANDEGDANATWRDITTTDIPAEGKGQFMTTTEISERLVVRGCIKHPMPLNRLGMILKKAGYPDKRVGVTRTRGWIVYEKEPEEVAAQRSAEGKG